jgi:hypothetical protein
MVSKIFDESSKFCSCSSEIYMPLKQALVPMSLFKITNYSAVVVTASVGTMIYFSMNILWPLQIAALYTKDNIEIGWLSVSKSSSPQLQTWDTKASLCCYS